MHKLLTRGLALVGGYQQKGQMEVQILLGRTGSRKKSSQKSFRGFSEGMEKQRELLQHWRHLQSFLQSVLSSRTLKEL